MPADDAIVREIARNQPAPNPYSSLQFKDLNGGTKRIVTQMRTQKRFPVGNGVRASDLIQATEYTGLEFGVARDGDGVLMVVKGTVKRTIFRSDDTVLAHTHPSYNTQLGNLREDLPRAGSEPEIIIDLGDDVIVFNEDGIISKIPLGDYLDGTAHSNIINPLGFIR
jgi:hypothetical protein